MSTSALRPVALTLFVAVVLFPPAGAADPASKYSPKGDVPIIPAAWRTAPGGTISSANIDHLLAAHYKGNTGTLAGRASDEQFLRRVSLDLTGKPPSADELEAFGKNSDPHKRSQAIDRLLASDAFARSWARYWRDVIVSRATNMQIFVRLPRSLALETWLFEQLKDNKSWGEITRSLITAEGSLELNEPTKNGALGFLMCHFGPDAAVERAAETSRVFLGIQIQCAQCHDHPSDIWKRNQFHEFAAYYGRTRERPRIGMGVTNPGIQLISVPFGEYAMPGKDNPRNTTTMHPRFLTGEALEHGKSDLQRRKALAERVTAKENYWFAAAFVNRTWAELMGQGFNMPIDNMGPLQEATCPELLVALSASFRNSDYNIKELFRVIANSAAYQRRMRMGETAQEHLQFNGVYPARLRADALWESLVSALGPLPEPMGGFFRPGQMGPGRRFGPPNLRTAFKNLFDFDPSTKPDEVEGSVPQALLLMNNATLSQQMKASGDTVLARILKDNAQDEDAIRQLYLRALSRQPSEREVRTCRDHLAQVGNRAEAYEDLLWALVNSTEFQTKR